MTDWGSVAEWVSGLGALAAAGVAVVVSVRGSKDAHRIAQEASEDARDIAREARRAAARDRTAGLLVDLVRAVERDIAAHPSGNGWWPSPEGQALCRALWGRRNVIGTVWHTYSEPGRWPDGLSSWDEVFLRMRDELQSALDSLDFEDR